MHASIGWVYWTE